VMDDALDCDGLQVEKQRTKDEDMMNDGEGEVLIAAWAHRENSGMPRETIIAAVWAGTCTAVRIELFPQPLQGID
jgi:hypothetical protein